jgi:hypothetical protein
VVVVVVVVVAVAMVVVVVGGVVVEDVVVEVVVGVPPPPPPPEVELLPLLGAVVVGVLSPPSWSAASPEVDDEALAIPVPASSSDPEMDELR